MKFLHLCLLLTFLFITCNTALADPLLILMNDKSENDFQHYCEVVRSAGGKIIHVFPPQAVIAEVGNDFEPDKLKQTEGIMNVLRQNETLVRPEGNPDLSMVLDIWEKNYFPENKLRSIESDRAMPPGGPLVNDALYAPKDERAGGTRDLPYGSATWQTSEFMLGSVSINIIIVESDGSIDTNQEDWSETRENTVVSEIQNGLNWLASKGPSTAGSLSFVYHVYRGRTDSRAQTGYEPITRTSSEEDLWIKEVMANLGYSSASRFTSLDNFNHNTRVADDTNWAVTIFVVDSWFDTDGLFTNSYFAYAYIGGPHIVMTYDNDGWGIGRMDSVVAHELCHSFYAMDEYTSAGVACTTRRGYLYYENQNSNLTPSCSTDVACVMRSESIASTSICFYTRGQIGIIDNDGDGIPDILDTFPNTSVTPLDPDPTEELSPTFTGSATVIPYPRQGSGIYDITINYIANVQYRIDGGSWNDADPVDGTFDGPEEDYTFTTMPLTGGNHTVEIRAINSAGNEETSYASDNFFVNDITAVEHWEVMD